MIIPKKHKKLKVGQIVWLVEKTEFSHSNPRDFIPRQCVVDSMSFIIADYDKKSQERAKYKYKKVINQICLRFMDGNTRYFQFDREELCRSFEEAKMTAISHAKKKQKWARQQNERWKEIVFTLGKLTSEDVGGVYDNS